MLNIVIAKARVVAKRTAFFSAIRSSHTLVSLLKQNPLPFSEIEQTLGKLEFDIPALERELTTPVGDHRLHHSPLHDAVTRRNRSLVELFMGFNAKTDLKNKDGLTPVELADHLAEKKDITEAEREEYLKISAIISTRTAFNNAYRDGLSFNRLARLFEKAKDNTRITQPIVFVFGSTQAGKSTFLNYLNGTDYQSDQFGITPISNTRSPEFDIGNNVGSKTISPKIIPLIGRAYMICDMPGLSETRLGEIAVCVATSRKMLFKRLEQAQPPARIQAILFVCEFNALTTGGQLIYRNVAAKIGRMLDKLSTHKHVLLAITKAPNTRDCMQHIRRILAEVRVDLQATLDTADRALPNYQESKACLLTTTILLEEDNRIFIGDVLDHAGASRIHVLDKIASLGSEPHDSFMLHDYYDAELTQFNSLMQTHVSEYERMVLDYKATLDALTERRGKLETLEGELGNYETDRSRLNLTSETDREQEIERCRQDMRTAGIEIKMLEELRDRNNEAIKANDDGCYVMGTEEYKFEQTLPKEALSHPDVTPLDPPLSYKEKAIAIFTNNPEIEAKKEMERRDREKQKKLRAIMGQHDVSAEAAEEMLAIEDLDHARKKEVCTYLSPETLASTYVHPRTGIAEELPSSRDVYLSNPPKPKAIAKFEFFDVDRCHEVLVGRVNESGTFLPFEEILPKHALPYITTFDAFYKSLSIHAVYDEMTKQRGMLQFKILGVRNYQGYITCKLRVWGFNSEERDVILKRREFMEENAEIALDIAAETRVKERRERKKQTLDSTRGTIATLSDNISLKKSEIDSLKKEVSLLVQQYDKKSCCLDVAKSIVEQMKIVMEACTSPDSAIAGTLLRLQTLNTTLNKLLYPSTSTRRERRTYNPGFHQSPNSSHEDTNSSGNSVHRTYKK